MRAITDLFIRHPVLAVVVNLVIVLVGWRSISALPIQQFPKVESSSVVITTVYTGASAETVRGFLTTPIERVVSAISGIDYLESQSREGVSVVTVLTPARLVDSTWSTPPIIDTTRSMGVVRKPRTVSALAPV